jgi:hypothetical protein
LPFGSLPIKAQNRNIGVPQPLGQDLLDPDDGIAEAMAKSLGRDAGYQPQVITLGKRAD